jgi:hypothetical protein
MPGIAAPVDTPTPHPFLSILNYTAVPLDVQHYCTSLFGVVANLVRRSLLFVWFLLLLLVERLPQLTKLLRDRIRVPPGSILTKAYPSAAGSAWRWRSSPSVLEVLSLPQSEQTCTQPLAAGGGGVYLFVHAASSTAACASFEMQLVKN